MKCVYATTTKKISLKLFFGYEKQAAILFSDWVIHVQKCLNSNVFIH